MTLFVLPAIIAVLVEWFGISLAEELPSSAEPGAE